MIKHWTEWAWDAWCIISGIGIWPRYIEPRLLEINRLVLPIPQLPSQLVGLKILHFSDLHWNAQFSVYLQKKLIRKINMLKPDFIVFTGDFICRSKLEDPERLKKTLNALQAKMGCFAILGNHDYADFVTVNEQGDYDVEAPSSDSSISKGFKRLFQPVTLTKQVTLQAQQVRQHADLMALLKETPFQVLNNRTQRVAHKGSWINICGLEEYALGRFNPNIAFQDYDTHYPGLILSHNPDTIDILKNYPGNVILSGHTHGGQVNLPILWKRFTRIEHLQFKSGLKAIDKKWVHVNRGISTAMQFQFRWFAKPELTLITLK